MIYLDKLKVDTPYWRGARGDSCIYLCKVPLLSLTQAIGDLNQNYPFRGTSQEIVNFTGNIYLWVYVYLTHYVSIYLDAMKNYFVSL